MSAWNVLATSLEGRRDGLLVALRRLGRFRPGGYRNVVAFDTGVTRNYEAGFEIIVLNPGGN